MEVFMQNKAKPFKQVNLKRYLFTYIVTQDADWKVNVNLIQVYLIFPKPFRMISYMLYLILPAQVYPKASIFRQVRFY